MKKTNLTVVFSVIFFLSLAVFTGCKKDDTNPTITSKPNDQQGSTEADGALSDVNDFISNKVGGGSGVRLAAYNLPCGVVSVDSTTSGGYKTYNLHYGNNTPCGYKYKSGTVSFSIPDALQFHNVGAIFSVTFIDYEVEVRATGQTVKLNGTISVKNVNGGYIWEAVANSSTIVHQIRGTFDVTYTDGTTRTRHYYQLRTWTSTGGWPGLSLEINGDTTIGADVISETGNTYEGNYAYQTKILTSLKWSNCGSTWAGPYVLKQGHAKLDVTVPALSPTYIDIEAGYYWDYNNITASPTLDNTCSSNAYKIVTVLGTSTTTNYQLY